jgi:hypothetical protein
MIATEKPNNSFPVTRMCRWAGVSESGFYTWVKAVPSTTAQWRASLAVVIVAIFEASNGVFGYRRIHVKLLEQGHQVCDKVVREIMVEQGLESCHPSPWRHLTQSDGTPPAPDLVARDFTATRPGVRLVGDITQIDTWEGRPVMFRHAAPSSKTQDSYPCFEASSSHSTYPIQAPAFPQRDAPRCWSVGRDD